MGTALRLPKPTASDGCGGSICGASSQTLVVFIRLQMLSQGGCTGWVCLPVNVIKNRVMSPPAWLCFSTHLPSPTHIPWMCHLCWISSASSDGPLRNPPDETLLQSASKSLDVSWEGFQRSFMKQCIHVVNPSVSHVKLPPRAHCTPVLKTVGSVKLQLLHKKSVCTGWIDHWFHREPEADNTINEIKLLIGSVPCVCLCACMCGTASRLPLCPHVLYISCIS